MNLTLAQPGLFLSKNTNKILALFTKVHMTATLLNNPGCFWPMWIGTEDPTHHCRAEQSPPDKKPRHAVSICNSQANEFMHLCAWSAAELRIRLNQVRVWFHNQREKIKSSASVLWRKLIKIRWSWVVPSSGKLMLFYIILHHYPQ